MAPLKFRLYKKSTGQMIDEGAPEVHCGYLAFSGAHCKVEQPEDWIIMQSTGLNDKHGVEIFEGDVLSYKQNDAAKQVVEQHEVVKFGEYRAGFDWSEYSGLGFYVEKIRVLRAGADETESWAKYTRISGITGLLSNQRCEVIGNIYQNPELLSS